MTWMFILERAPFYDFKKIANGKPIFLLPFLSADP